MRVGMDTVLRSNRAWFKPMRPKLFASKVQQCRGGGISFVAMQRHSYLLTGWNTLLIATTGEVLVQNRSETSVIELSAWEYSK